MAFTAKFFNYAKNSNSTSIPNETGTDFSITLKKGCSIVAPVIELQFDFNLGAPVYNYAYIPAFGRYYFVNDWTFNNRLWIASLTCDVLATYRTQINNSTQYVLRSASNFDGYLVDNLYCLKNNFDSYLIDLQSKSPNRYTGMADGTYIIGIINGDTNAFGAVSYYIMSQPQIQALRDFLLGNGTQPVSDFMSLIMAETDDISSGAVKALFNPFQYIASCMWLPMALWEDTPTTYEAVYSLKFGYWNYTDEGRLVAQKIASNQAIYSPSISDPYFDAHLHPQSVYPESRGMYLNGAPYTENTLFFPPFGSIPLDGIVLGKLNNGRVRFKECVDLITGMASLYLYGFYDTGNNTSQEVALCPPITAQLGIPIQLANIGTNYMANNVFSLAALGSDVYAQMTNLNGQGTAVAGVDLGGIVNESIMNTIPGGAIFNAFKGMVNNPVNRTINEYVYGESANDFPDALNSIGAGVSSAIESSVTGIGNACRAMMTGVTTKGNNGTIADLYQYPYFQQIFYRVCNDDNQHRGRPYCTKTQLSNLSGYCQCADPEVAFTNCTEIETKAIKHYMVQGFYLE